MWATVQNVIEIMEEFASPGLAMDGDNCGLQIGNPREPVQSILVALEMGRDVLNEALERGAGMVVSHHPLLYHRLSAVDESSPTGALIAQIIRNKVNLYSAHTNLDTAPGGVSYLLAERLGFNLKECTVLEKTAEDRLLKLAVFVPADHAMALLDALAKAGAGWIGKYSHCTFRSPGTGTFLPREGTNPAIGIQGRLEEVREVRLETVLPASKRSAVLKAMLNSHPYEEVAYDLYALERPGTALGLGLIGVQEPALSLENILERCRTRLDVDCLRYRAHPETEKYSRIAVCGGAGGRLVVQAARCGAQVYISGDMGYHDLQAAAELGLTVIDAGHYATEEPVVGFLERYLRRRLAEEGFATGVLAAVSARAGRWLNGGEPGQVYDGR